MDREALQAVAEDLLHLRAAWKHDIPDAEVRRGSATLRRLLVEDAYGNAWRSVGLEKEPSVVAVDLERNLEGTPRQIVVYALAGGANFRGMSFASPMVLKGSQPSTRNFNPPTTPDSYPGEQRFPLSRFLSSTAGIVEGRPFTRRDVIKYIAYIKGGVHLGGKPRKAEQKLIDRMRKMERRIIVHQTDGLLIELVAVAQAIARSTDLEVFLSRLPTDMRRRAEQSVYPVSI